MKKLKYIKCLLSYHNWDWSKEVINYTYSQVKICQNCHKKQRYLNGQGWIDWNILSKEEIRDKKLNELGI